MKPSTSDIPSTSTQQNDAGSSVQQNGAAASSQQSNPSIAAAIQQVGAGAVSQPNKASTSNHRNTTGVDSPSSFPKPSRKRKKVIIDDKDGEDYRMSQRKFLRVDTWENGEKSNLIAVLKEMYDNDEENLFFSEDPEVIDELSKKIKAKLDSVGSLMIAERRVSELLRHFIRKLKKERATSMGPVDRWLEMMRALSPMNKHLEQQLKSAIMVAIEEPIPQFDKDNENLRPGMPEPNYAAVYNYVACAVSGQPLPELTAIDSLLVEDCMQSLIEQIKTLDDGDLRLNLRKFYLCLNKTEGQMPEEDEDEIFNQLAKGTLFNPLGINQNLIVPVPPE